MYYKFIEISKNYFFCDLCGKCYIYRGSYEKHKLICEKKKNKNNIIDNIDFLIEENKIINKNGVSKIQYNDSSIGILYEDEEDYNIKRREKPDYKFLNNNDFVEIICPFYLFFMTLILGFIKGIFCGF